MTRKPVDLLHIKQELRSFVQLQGRMPSFSEMQELLGYRSKGAVRYIVAKLAEAGIVEQDQKGKLIARDLGDGVRLLGSIAAGFPAPAEETALATLSFDQLLVDRPESTYVLKVDGDSMIEAGINPGDMVVVERGREARHGDIVVAEIDGAWTLKYFESHKGKVILKPANPNYPPFEPSETLVIGGVVIAVVRRYQR